LVDVPTRPNKPRVLLSHTSESRIAVEWDAVISNLNPGGAITGYVLEMKDTRSQYGTFEVILDGSNGYPDIRSI
jgi:hypothetical protein